MDVVIPGGGRPYSEGDSFDHGAPLAFTIDGVLSEDECRAMVARIDEAGPTAAPITTARGFVMMPEVRNNTRVVFDDHRLARDLFARIADALPPRVASRKPVGANERFRCYRYAAGQYFAPHRDGAFWRDDGERSLLTFMIYLNAGFDGGRTTFHEYGVTVEPAPGRALLFQHLLLHEGCEVERGVKYALRSDIMFA